MHRSKLGVAPMARHVTTSGGCLLSTHRVTLQGEDEGAGETNRRCWSIRKKTQLQAAVCSLLVMVSAAPQKPSATGATGPEAGHWGRGAGPGVGTAGVQGALARIKAGNDLTLHGPSLTLYFHSELGGEGS